LELLPGLDRILLLTYAANYLIVAVDSREAGMTVKLAIFLLVVILLLTAHSAPAAETREIEMSDGSVVTGEVLSLSKGIYTIKSDSLGTIKIDESKVRVIRPRGSGTSQSSGGDVRSLQNKMMNDQEIMSMIQSLQNDPEFKKLLEDPDIMQAVSAGDISALMANPKFTKLLNNSTVQDIQKKVK
jgi:hypothetical protein